MHPVICLYGSTKEITEKVKEYLLSKYHYIVQKEITNNEVNNIINPIAECLSPPCEGIIIIFDNLLKWHLFSKYPLSYLIILHDNPNSEFYKNIVSLPKHQNVHHIYNFKDDFEVFSQIPTFSRMSWEEYFIEIAFQVSKRSNCKRRMVGCVIVKNNRIISTGYNGTASGITNCMDNGCLRCSSFNISSGNQLNNCLCLHAEENAILMTRKSRNLILYTTVFPCILCSLKIIQFGIKKIFYAEEYINDDKNIKELFDKSNVIYKKI